MFKTTKKRLKDQRGLTLIELLAVVVILGIIAAIAVPSIGKIIDNTKEKAHIANAQQMVSAAKMKVAANEVTFGTATSVDIKLSKLIEDGYLQGSITNPEDKTNGYNEETSIVKISKSGNSLAYNVTLIQDVTTSPESYLSNEDPFTK